MNPAEPLKHLRSRPQQQVIGIGQQDLGTGFLEGFGELRFHCRLGAHRHEQGGAHFIVQGAEDSGPGTGAVRHRFEAEIQSGRGHQPVPMPPIGGESSGKAGPGERPRPISATPGVRGCPGKARGLKKMEG